MSEKSKTKVYVLGAGCSVSNGYPVAKNFLPELDSFGDRLDQSAVRLKRCVTETAALMRKAQVQTVDDLTVRIHNGHFDSDSSHGTVVNTQRRNQRVLEAKIATAAMLLAKEKAAAETGLHNYHHLINEMFSDGVNWEQKFKKSNSHVLTFNYDRLFELAMLKKVEPELNRKFGTYSKGLLNSGLNPFTEENVEFDDARFSFLKLHGSIGAWAKPTPMGIEHHPFDQAGFDLNNMTDERFFATTDPKNMAVASWPLLIFPFEKQHIHAGGEHFYYQKYIKAVWDKAEALITTASEIYVIGYSFHSLDREPLIRLLRNARNCKQVVIQNLPGEAQRICQMLEVKYHEIPMAWKLYTIEF